MPFHRRLLPTGARFPALGAIFEVTAPSRGARAGRSSSSGCARDRSGAPRPAPRAPPRPGSAVVSQSPYSRALSSCSASKLESPMTSFSFQSQESLMTSFSFQSQESLMTSFSFQTREPHPVSQRLRGFPARAERAAAPRAGRSGSGARRVTRTTTRAFVRSSTSCRWAPHQTVGERCASVLYGVWGEMRVQFVPKGSAGADAARGAAGPGALEARRPSDARGARQWLQGRRGGGRFY